MKDSEVRDGSDRPAHAIGVTFALSTVLRSGLRELPRYAVQTSSRRRGVTTALTPQGRLLPPWTVPTAQKPLVRWGSWHSSVPSRGCRALEFALMVLFSYKFILDSGPAEQRGREDRGKGSPRPGCFQQFCSSCFQGALARAPLWRVVDYAVCNGHENECGGECTHILVNII